MSKLDEILEGWRNHIIPKAKEKEMIKLISQERMSICNECPLISTKHSTLRKDVHCTDCGCPLFTKTKSLQSSCPQGKWLSITKE